MTYWADRKASVQYRDEKETLFHKEISVEQAKAFIEGKAKIVSVEPSEKTLRSIKRACRALTYSSFTGKIENLDQIKYIYRAMIGGDN